MDRVDRIQFEGMPPSPSLQADIERHCRELQRLAPLIDCCEVDVRRAEPGCPHGHRYLVHVRVSLSGRVVEGGRTARPDHSHADAHLAVRDAFDAVARRLREALRRELRRRGG